jgi:hypothetical protein
MKNSSSGPLTVAAPNPFQSVWIGDPNGIPHTRVRSVRYNHTVKSARLEPKEALDIIIDLFNYCHDVQGSCLVRIRFEVTDDHGVRHEQFVEGEAFLKVPSYEERLEETKRNPRPRGGPIKVFDVSDSTRFERVY